MARFDWKAEVISQACEIESTFEWEKRFPDLSPMYERERNTRAVYAAWLCRSYRSGKPFKYPPVWKI